jgi:putative DNA primase/helicase
MSGTDEDDFAARVGAAGGGDTAGGWDDEDDAPEFSDEDLALRFASQHVYTMRHVAKLGRWFKWTGKVWSEDEKRVAFSLARQVARAAARECNPKQAPSIASAKTVAAIERLAQADPRLATTVDIWDANPWLLNTPDGVIDLRTGKLQPHSSGDFMTQITAVGPGGDCPRFRAFISEIMAGDEEMVAFVQRMLGYCLTGDISEETVCFIYGTGQNGKGVLTSTVEWIMAGYCKSANDELFTQTHNDRHPTEVARLKGARMVLVTEVEEGRRWDEAKLKKMTGGDTLTARLMRQDFFEFKPQFKPVISGNHKPQIKSVDTAMRRRINLVPFSVTIPPEKRDNELKAKLRAEGPGILQWLIDGCLGYQRIGLAPPASVVAATDEYFKEEDNVANWISEQCEIGKAFFEPSSRLFAFWRHYAEKARLPAGNSKKFKAEMNRLGFAEKRGSAGIAYHGLQIRQGAQEPPAPSGGYDPDRRDAF